MLIILFFDFILVLLGIHMTYWAYLESNIFLILFGAATTLFSGVLFLLIVVALGWILFEKIHNKFR